MNRSGRIAYCVYPCPCGYYGDTTKECTCSPSMVTKYQKRISGPLLDPLRVDTLRASRRRACPLRVKSSRASDWADRRRWWRRGGRRRATGSRNALHLRTATSSATRTREAARRGARARSVQAGCNGAITHALGDAKRATATFRTSISSRAQDRADDCRLGWK